MREIKFRAWDKNKKDMIFDSIEFETRLLNSNSDGDGSRYIGFSNFHFNLFEIMQFTGLTDKNGKEVYEGDVVKGIEYWPFHPNESIDETIGEIIFDELLYGYSITDGNKPICHMDEIEVIGNVYQNPELL